jgi:PPK2 family polyphosphate:nucleotide phosphotransferase
MNINAYRFKDGQFLQDYSPDDTGKFNTRKESAKLLKNNKKLMAELQDKLYAHDSYGVLIILQAIDAAGKDGIIKHVMSAVNPQGCQVKSFKKPSSEELDHDYMWRCMKHLPERGNIAIFNRSYYEEVLIARVHPKVLDSQKLPLNNLNSPEFWSERYNQINMFEKYMYENGFPVLKFFLNISKDEQKNRFLKRIQRPDKNWKFSMYDLQERSHWDRYMEVFELMLQKTSTEYSPWHVIPSNNKWFSRLLVSEIIKEKLNSLNLSYPEVSKEMKKHLLEAEKHLKNE